jgi:hypothetical protein
MTEMMSGVAKSRATGSDTSQFAVTYQDGQDLDSKCYSLPTSIHLSGVFYIYTGKSTGTVIYGEDCDSRRRPWRQRPPWGDVDPDLHDKGRSGHG